jgi:2',3'-cyclic-nucleotide 2'-phosphodiesterase / 3'-nucleotidase
MSKRGDTPNDLPGNARTRSPVAQTEDGTILRRDLMRDALTASLAVSLAGTITAATAGPARAAAADRVTLQVLSTTDLHMYLEDYDYYADRPDSDVGLVRVAPLIRAARAASPNTLLVDNGDLIQGTPMGDWVARERGVSADMPHPAIVAMNQLGYDAAVLGNHEFNFGLDTLLQTYAAAKFPVLAGNVMTLDPVTKQPTGETLYPAFTVLDRELKDGNGRSHRVRIGLLGVLTPQIMIWDRDKLEGRVNTTDMVESARALVPALRAQGCDVIIALSHAGLSPAPRVGGEENASAYLTAIEGIDAVITGHSHRVFPGPDFRDFPGADLQKGTINGCPLVMAGSYGSHLGVTDLVLERAGTGWRVIDGRSEARPITRRVDGRVVPATEPDTEVAALIAAAHEGTLRYVRRPVGRTTGRIHSYFAFLGDSAGVEIVAEAQRFYAEKALKGTAHAGLPILSASAPFKSGGRPGPEFYTDIAAGEIAIRNVADLYVFPNQLTAVRLTGAQVREWLEMSVRIFRTIDPASPAPQPLLDRRIPGYNFDVIDGLTYTIDLTRASRYDRDGKLTAPDARRITEVRFQDQPLVDSQEFIVVTNNYRANGGGSFPALDGRTVVYQSPDTVQQVLVDYIRDRGVIEPTTDNSFRFAPLPAGLTIVYDSGPVAQQLLAEVPMLSYLGPGENGFINFKFDLSQGTP